MILPLGDAPNPRGVAIVTYLLIAANVAVYLLRFVSLGHQPVSPRDPTAPPVLVSMFLRGGSHLSWRQRAKR